MKEKFEIFEDNQWKELTEQTAAKINSEDYWRRTRIYDDDLYKEYFLGINRHRLDGPSFEHFHKGKYFTSHWDVHDVGVIYFSHYFNLQDISWSLFQYIRHYPEYIKQIDLLARHNHWLTEEQILCLAALSISR